MLICLAGFGVMMMCALCLTQELANKDDLCLVCLENRCAFDVYKMISDIINVS